MSKKSNRGGMLWGAKGSPWSKKKRGKDSDKNENEGHVYREPQDVDSLRYVNADEAREASRKHKKEIENQKKKR